MPGPASLAMQIGTCETKVNRVTRSMRGKRGKYFNANSGFDYMFLSLFVSHRNDLNFLSLEAK